MFDEEADLGWTDPEPICRGSPVGWVGGGDLSLVCFSFPLFAHYGDVTEIYNKGFAPWTSCQTQDCSHFLFIITSLQFLQMMAMTSIPQLGGESEAIISVPTPFLKRDRITPISNVGGVKTVSGSFQHWKRFNCLETMWPIVSYHNLSLKFKIILVFETRSSENNLW